jgi:hypothetical protein
MGCDQFSGGITAIEATALIDCLYGINPFALAIVTEKTYKASEG